MEIGRKSIGKCEVREYISLTQQQMENEVSVLNGLKLVSAKRPAALSAIQFRRNKLIVKLNDQIQLAKAMKDGSTYAPMRTRTIKNRETGEVRQIEVAKKVKAWFFTADSGKVCVQLRYGSKTIDFSKGKNSVEVSSSTPEFDTKSRFPGFLPPRP